MEQRQTSWRNSPSPRMFDLGNTWARTCAQQSCSNSQWGCMNFPSSTSMQRGGSRPCLSTCKANCPHACILQATRPFHVHVAAEKPFPKNTSRHRVWLQQLCRFQRLRSMVTVSFVTGGSSILPKLGHSMGVHQNNPLGIT